MLARKTFVFYEQDASLAAHFFGLFFQKKETYLYFYVYLFVDPLPIRVRTESDPYPQSDIIRIRIRIRQLSAPLRIRQKKYG